MGDGKPKQYLLLAGRTVLEHSLNVLLDCPAIETVMVALSPDDHSPATLDCFSDDRVIHCRGGETRSDSVLAALEALSEFASPEEWVLVHDAARPCVSPADIMSLVTQVRSSGVGGILAEPIVDTVKRADADGRVGQTLDRSSLWRAQTPQMFRLDLLRSALREAKKRGLLVTDDASAMEAAGHPVQLVAASPRNLKITVPADLQLAEFYLKHSGVHE
jgi:2-C-methyl-D-erythritol 4-phosphate cytidylyltransferase